jgi:hypothetical protein
MSISYPLNMPTDVIGISEIELRAENTVGLTQSPFTYRQQVFQYPGQRWTASISIAPVNRQFGEPWVAFLLALNGQAGTFLLGDPLGSAPRGTIGTGSTVRINGNQAAGGTSINIKGLPTSRTGVFLPGDYIQLGSGATATLHKILLAANSNSSGQATLFIWPYARRALVDNEIVTYVNARGRFRLAGNQQAWSIANNLRYGVQFEAVEAV